MNTSYQLCGGRYNIYNATNHEANFYQIAPFDHRFTCERHRDLYTLKDNSYQPEIIIPKEMPLNSSPLSPFDFSISRLTFTQEGSEITWLPNFKEYDGIIVSSSFVLNALLEYVHRPDPLHDDEMHQYLDRLYTVSGRVNEAPASPSDRSRKQVACARLKKAVNFRLEWYEACYRNNKQLSLLSSTLAFERAKANGLNSQDPLYGRMSDHIYKEEYRRHMESGAPAPGVTTETFYV